LWRYEIVHIFSAGYSSYTLWTIPALLVSKLYGKKIILNYRDGQAEDHLRNWRTAIPTVKLADVIVAPSGFLVDVFAQFGLKARSIFNNIDMTRFRYRERRKLQPVFMTNRILEPLYNIGCLMRAFQIVQQRYPDASLTIAHDGPSRAELEQLAVDLGLQNTRFIGRVPHEKVAELYDSAEIYLTSPDIDCMPGSLLECYASGLPVVATKAGGIPYISTNEKTALLVPIGDYTAMAECAFRLLEDEELVARLIEGGRRELEKYSWSSVRDRWLGLYRELVGTQ
jgi:glycosyltransferase involved in cell wall biosynthesis